jgi:23S rRNA pseudouridine1911/1915/1917 synthase
MSNLEISRGKRLDQYVLERIPELSRSSAQKLCDEGRVTVNGKPAKPGYKVRPTDTILIDFDRQELAIIPDIEIPILYEDDDCIVMNKPIGVLTHSKGAFNPEATVASFVQSHLPDNAEWKRDEGIHGRVGIVHRLDRATSGVIIAAKHPKALSFLQKQFSLRKVKKTYIAIVEGRLKHDEAVIDMPIERNPKKPQMFRVGPAGKPAKTTYKVLEANDETKLSLIELKPETGRTHQLRVHMNELGHPILGDEFYGGKHAKRLFLHAYELEITLPNRQRMTFQAPLPDEFRATIEA